MPITIEQLKKMQTPFFVVADYVKGAMKGKPRKIKPSECVGFSSNDPLGVGGGIFPDNPTAYFKSGGWVLVEDLMRYHSIVSPDWLKKNGGKR